jgi:hypothetical protein
LKVFAGLQVLLFVVEGSFDWNTCKDKANTAGTLQMNSHLNENKNRKSYSNNKIIINVVAQMS